MIPQSTETCVPRGSPTTRSAGWRTGSTIAWVHPQRQLEHLPECTFVNDEPERRFRVGNRYHFRAKRHAYGSIATDPTQGALEFMEQVLTLDGMEEVRLLLGYIGDREERAIKEAVISLRDSRDSVIWLEALAEPAAGSAAAPLAPTSRGGPTLPEVVIDTDKDSGTAANDEP